MTDKVRKDTESSTSSDAKTNAAIKKFLQQMSETLHNDDNKYVVMNPTYGKDGRDIISVKYLRSYEYNMYKYENINYTSDLQKAKLMSFDVAKSIVGASKLIIGEARVVDGKIVSVTRLQY